MPMYSRSRVFLVFEYAQHDLANLIDNHYTQHKCSPFSESEVKRLMLQLLEAIRFIHSKYILHRDLKLSNLLYNHRGELRIADFGLARRVGGQYVGDKRRTTCTTTKSQQNQMVMLRMIHNYCVSLPKLSVFGIDLQNCCLDLSTMIRVVITGELDVLWVSC